MEQKILQNEPLHKREQYLRDSAERIETMTYPRPLDDEELGQLKTEFTSDAIELDRHEQKKKEAMEYFKSVSKPLKMKMAETMTMIRSRQEEVTEEVYLLPDHDENMMGYYNSVGILVYQRPLMQQERQLRIVDSSKTNSGTN